MGFAENLKELRKALGLSHLQLATKIGYSKAIISFWENGKKEPTLSALLALADFFNVSADYLLGREDESGAKVRVHIGSNNGSIGNIQIGNNNRKG